MWPQKKNQITLVLFHSEAEPRIFGLRLTSESFILRSGQLSKLFAASNVVSSSGDYRTKSDDASGNSFRTGLW